MRRSELFSDVTALNFALAGIARDQESMRRAFVFVVSDNFFSFMGAQPAAGRFFTPEEGGRTPTSLSSSRATVSGNAWAAP